MEIDIILHALVIICPLAFIFCAYKALKGTKIHKVDDAPTALRASCMNINEPERKWNLKD